MAPLVQAAAQPGRGFPAAAACGWDEYRRRVAHLRAGYAAIPAGVPVRLAKKTSNLFRTRKRSGRALGLDVSAMQGIVAVDANARTADVLGMTTYEQLVDATLAHGLMPKVVPQLKTITVGGAVSGLGIESSSFRNGMPHESVLELDVLTGDGAVVTARPDNEHRALYFGFPNSYGTLGYALRVRIELEEVSPYVHLRHVRFHDAGDLATGMEAVCKDGEFAGEAVHFVDGTLFSSSEGYMTLGSWTGEASSTSDYTWMNIYYRSIQARREDWLTVRDYLWRWDTDWFWCSGAFGVQRRWVRRLVGRRFLRSDVYWKLVAVERRLRRDRSREDVIQDVEVPVDRVGEFVAEFSREVGITPVWLCPLRQYQTASTWDLYRLDPDVLYVNLGFWSRVPLAAGMDPAHHNRWVEHEVERLGGRKSLYSSAFYDEQRFWRLYNGEVYRQLKSRYDPDGRLLDLYDKCVLAR
jgi:FAD/FMN-containing dehydrogenase